MDTITEIREDNNGFPQWTVQHDQHRDQGGKSDTAQTHFQPFYCIMGIIRMEAGSGLAMQD